MKKSQIALISRRLQHGLNVADTMTLDALNAWSKGLAGENYRQIPQEYEAAFRLGVLIQTVRTALDELKS